MENEKQVRSWIPFRKDLTKEEFSWVLYDWASQSYVMIVMTVIMSLFFIEATNRAGVENASVFWSWTNSASMVVIGLLAPIIGTLSGYKGKKKILFTVFAVMGLLGTFGLAFVPESLWPVILGVFFISSIGYAGNTKVYDTFLVDVTDNKRMNWISSLGFAFGYIGGALPFMLSIPLVVLVQLGILDMDIMLAYRVAFVIAVVWWLAFMGPFMKNVHQKIGSEPENQYVRKSFVRIWTTAKEIATQKHILIFLVAFFLYSDGVGSIIRMATMYGASIGIDEITLLAVLLVTQFVAMPCAVIYGKMSQKVGAKKMIYFAIFTYCVICTIALFMNPARDDSTLRIMFWALAMLVGTAQGGIQALSRSYFARIIPKEKSNEYFGFYNVCSRFASMLGTFIFGAIALATGYEHYGIAGIAILFIAAAIIFKFVPGDKDFNKDEGEAA
ncbi:MAG: MFS transporter [Defluviitaleaceae bacterium]|nr:MFS transporter [Defluviitaleaceae bacterium]MCL2274006.1 MFS transporter [Defluviitaleaceae bacterium]MCL2274093.1 MFS transporter [Defluviitaleaceae bacterium]